MEDPLRDVQIPRSPDLREWQTTRARNEVGGVVCGLKMESTAGGRIATR